MRKINSIAFLLMLLLVTISSRFIPFPVNFSPITAGVLFAGAYLRNKWLKYLVPLAFIWLSDVVLNNFIYTEFTDGFTFFYKGSGVTYLAFVGIIFIGSLIKESNQFSVFLGAFSASFLFFVFSNFGVWLFSGLYSLSYQGLLKCYVLALPFFKNSIASTFLFSLLLFGFYELVYKKKSLVSMA